MKRRRRPISPVSAKRLAEAPARTAVREAAIARDRRCVASDFVLSVPCTEWLEVDEMQGRGRQPGSHLDLDAVQCLCGPCHRLKTDEPRLAGLLGLYGPDEQARRLGEEGLVTLGPAVDEWARRKAVLRNRDLVPPIRGNLEAVLVLWRARSR